MVEGYKSNYIQIARDLHYGKECLQKLINAKTEEECLMIMATYRKKI